MLTLNERTTITSPENDNDPVEELRRILACRQQFVSHEEAAEIGESLLAFFELLAQPKEPDYEQ